MKLKTALIAGALIYLGILETKLRIHEEMSGLDFYLKEEVSEDSLFDDDHITHNAPIKL